MARPSVKEERAETILLAFERCVSRYGVEGATLERIAQESGLHRSLLRHHVGNREALIECLIERCMGDEKKEMQWLRDDLGINLDMKSASVDEGSEKIILAYLFADMPEQERVRMKVALALLAAVENYPNIKVRLKQWDDVFMSNLQALLGQLYPSAGNQQCRDVAWGLASLSLSYLSMAPLGATGNYRDSSVRSATILLRSLDKTDVASG